MTQEDLLQFCKYYKGGEENPYQSGINGSFWFYEKKWIEFTLDATKRHDANSILGNMLGEYISVGLSDFSNMDGVPITLKAVLFNRYGHWSSLPMLEVVDAFKKFYLEKYLK